ncbi:MAG: hypothetical protein R3E66_12655 [bacterium]
MSVSFHQLLGYVVAADAGFHDSAELGQLLAKAGFGKELAASAHDLAHKGEELWKKYTSAEENRIGDHSVHLAVSELEMWAQTAKAILRTKLAADVIATAMGAHIHATDHTTTAIAQAYRLLAMLRTDEKVQGCFKNERQLHDVSQRGWALLKKLFATCNTRLDAETQKGQAVAAEVEAYTAKLQQWVEKLAAAAPKLSTHAHLLGLLGYVPEGVGRPIGGTAFDVVLHERGQGQVPDPAGQKPTSGWSIGRQGRNNENLGKGWIEPKFS